MIWQSFVYKNLADGLVSTWINYFLDTQYKENWTRILRHTVVSANSLLDSNTFDIKHIENSINNVAIEPCYNLILSKSFEAFFSFLVGYI